MLIRDFVDFAAGDLQTFQGSLVRAVCGSNPPDIAAVEPLLPIQIDLERRAHSLHLKHLHYSQLIGLDLTPLYRNIAEMREPMIAVVEAREWPSGAQVERCARLNTAFSTLGNTMTAVELSLAEKRVEFINNTKTTTAEN